MTDFLKEAKEIKKNIKKEIEIRKCVQQGIGFRLHEDIIIKLKYKLKALKEELDNLLGGCDELFEQEDDVGKTKCSKGILCPSCKSKIPTQEDIAEFYKICEVVLDKNG